MTAEPATRRFYCPTCGASRSTPGTCRHGHDGRPPARLQAAQPRGARKRLEREHGGSVDRGNYPPTRGQTTALRAAGQPVPATRAAAAAQLRELDRLHRAAGRAPTPST